MAGDSTVQVRRPSWPVSLAGLLLLVPVGWTVWMAASFAWDLNDHVAGALAALYAVAGVALMGWRLAGLWRERWGH